MTTDAGNVSVRHLRQTTCLEAEEAGSEFQEEIPGNLLGGNLDHPVLGKLVKYLKSQQRNPTNLTQWTAKVSDITTLVTSSQESTNRRMALRAQLPSGMGEGGAQDSADTLPDQPRQVQMPHRAYGSQQAASGSQTQMQKQYLENEEA